MKGLNSKRGDGGEVAAPVCILQLQREQPLQEPLQRRVGYHDVDDKYWQSTGRWKRTTGASDADITQENDWVDGPGFGGCKPRCWR